MFQVEVLLPIKSPAPWLGETLHSLQAQSFASWRLVASIHGMNEEVRAKVLAYFPNSTIVNSRENGNLATTLNTGLAATTAPFIARLDQDDIAHPERLLKQVSFLENNPNFLAVGTSAHLIGPDGQTHGYRSQIVEPVGIHKRLRWKSPLIHPSVMYRSGAVIALGGYSETAVNVEDYELWLRLGAVGEIGGINEPLIKYRIHPNQMSSVRSIPSSAVNQISQSRIAYARARDHSLIAAKFRQQIWALRQILRRVQRRNGP